MKQLCGGLYSAAVKAVEDCPGDRLSIGFLIGQAEKVFMGACGGCMTRDIEIYVAAMRIAEVYGLSAALVSPEMFKVRAPEIWIYRDRDDMELKFLRYEINSPEWNLHRAAICGVPAENIDLDYHR